MVFGNFALNLLTNYASNAIPELFQQQPNLLWIFIGVLILLLTILFVINEFRNNPIPQPKKVEQESTPINISEQSYAGDRNASEYDVFISYSHKDSKFVDEKLLPFLKQRSFTYCIDKENFQTGSTSVEEIERCIQHSNRVILVLTKDYIKSEWAKFENIMVQTSDPSAKFRKLIPILIQNCDLPLRLKIYHYRDLRSDDETQWTVLARDLE
jgi:hypothetical protein